MGTIKDRNGMDLTEAEDIKKRWQEYTELYKKVLMTQITMMVWSLIWSQTSWNAKSSGPLEALLWTKVVEMMEFQLLFQILKDDAIKVLHSICQQIWKTQQWPQDWKRSALIPNPKKGNAKEYSNYHTNSLSSHASKIILQARLQQYVNWKLPNTQAGFIKDKGTRDQIANIW